MEKSSDIIGMKEAKEIAASLYDSNVHLAVKECISVADKKASPIQTQFTPQYAMNESFPSMPDGAGGNLQAPYTRIDDTSTREYRLQRQQEQSMPRDVDGDKWKRQIPVARITWEAFSEQELLDTEGHAEKLASLIHDRYMLTREEADTQVAIFIERVSGS